MNNKRTIENNKKCLKVVFYKHILNFHGDNSSAGLHTRSSEGHVEFNQVIKKARKETTSL